MERIRMVLSFMASIMHGSVAKIRRTKHEIRISSFACYAATLMPLDIPAMRRQFPILDQIVGGRPLIYLDNAATAQKPRSVLDAMTSYYETSNANAHRGMHVLAERSTVALEDARKTVQQFLHAKRPEEIVFTKNCTEALNMVARGLGSALQDGDAVLISILEHHSNVVPWLMLKEEKGVGLLWIDCDDRGRLKMDQFEEFLRHGNVKLVSVTAQSNVLGVRPPLKEIIRISHRAGALVCIDAAQAVAHEALDVQELDCDFLAFSGHKLYGPLGIGVLYGKKELLDRLPPLLGGGMMIHEVHTDRYSVTETPAKFEGGTQPIAEAIGLAAAIRWLSQFSWNDIEAHEQSLLTHAHDLLSTIPGLRILGPSPSPSPSPSPIAACLSFIIDNVHPHDLTEVLGRRGICLRAGHHCTQPLHRRLGVGASTRVSVGIYNTLSEIQSLSLELRSAAIEVKG